MDERTVSCCGTVLLLRGFTAATAERWAPLLFGAGFSCTAGFTTDGFTFSLGLTGREEQ